MSVARWILADKRYRAADKAACAAAVAALPAGTEVSWMHGEYRIWGEVLSVNSWGYHTLTVLIRRRNGKEYHVHASRILSEMEP